MQVWIQAKSFRRTNELLRMFISFFVIHRKFKPCCLIAILAKQVFDQLYVKKKSSDGDF